MRIVRRMRKTLTMTRKMSTRKSMEMRLPSLLAMKAILGKLSEEALKTKIKFLCLSYEGPSACTSIASSMMRRFH